MLWSAFILGLMGSFHCVGMCGPIAFLLPVDRSNSVRKITQTFTYHLGRLLAYGLMGLIFGLIGRSLYIFGIQQQLSIAIGVLMIVVVLVPSRIVNKYKISQPIYIGISKVKSALGKALKKKTADTFLTIGFLNGFLPCGLVYMAVFAALATGQTLLGSLYMVVFGIGNSLHLPCSNGRYRFEHHGLPLMLIILQYCTYGPHFNRNITGIDLKNLDKLRIRTMSVQVKNNTKDAHQ